MAAWSHRMVRDEKGKLHFAALQFRPGEDEPSGVIGIFNVGDNIEDMRRLAGELLEACEEPIYDLQKTPEEDDDLVDDGERSRLDPD